MPDIDLFSAGGGAGFDEGWAEGSIEGSVDVGGGIHAQLCHGIDLGVDVEAAAQANAHLRLIVIGARANVGAHARAGVRGRVTFGPNVFEEFGITARIEAAAEVAARAELEIALEADYVAELAAEQIDGLALELFLAFLREIRVGGGVRGKIAYSAMAKAWMQASGRLGDDEDAGFTIGGGYAAGFKGGYGMDYFMRVGFENPRRFFSTAVGLIVDEIVGELEDQLPPGSEIGIELFRLLVPAGLHAAYDVGQKSISQGISTPEEIVRPFLVAFAEELQRYLVDKATEFAAELIAGLIDEAIARLSGRQIDDAERQSIIDAVTAMNTALADGDFGPEDLDEVLAFAFAVAEAASPEMVDRFRTPATMLWTASVVGVALRDVGAVIGGDVSILGFGVGARLRIREMPPVSSMPAVVVEEYLADVVDFDGTSLTFDHAMDYLVTNGIGPMLAEHAPGVVGVLDQLHRVTGISPGNIATFGIQGALGGPVTDTELYVELKAFVRNSVDELIARHVFEPFDDLTAANPDARLYMDEVARPTIDLMVSFVFDQLDVVVDDPSVLGGLDYLTKLQSGLSSLLYKIVARNIVVLEQIASDTVRAQAVGAMGQLETAVRSDDANAIVTATVDHVDDVLANVSEYVPVVPGSTGLTQEQLDAIREFAAEMLNIGQEALGDDVFTNARWNRRREALLALMLSLDAQFDWGGPDPIGSAVDAMLACSFVPDEEAIQDLFDVHVDLLADQVLILLRRLPEPLSKLVLALTGPQLEDVRTLSAAARDLAVEAWETATAALETLLGLIDAAAGMAAQAATDLAAAVTDTVALVDGLAAAAVRTDLVEVGQANLRAAGEALEVPDMVLDPIVDGFGATLDATFTVLGGVIDTALAVVRGEQFIEVAVAGAVSGLSTSDLVVAGSGASFEPDAIDAFESAVRDSVFDLFVPADGTPPAAGLTITVPSPNGTLTAISPADVVDVVADAVLDAIDAVPLIGPALREAYHAAVEAAHRANEAAAIAAVATAETERAAVGDRDDSEVDVFSPVELDPRPDRTFLHGSVVPLSLRVRRAGAGWHRNDDARRIQISTNGLDLRFPAEAWTYDADREELSLDTILRLEDGHVRAGLNALEVSVAHGGSDGDADPVRTVVHFLVDPDVAGPDAGVSIDGAASQFDSPGSDHRSAYEEYVTIRWTGSGRLDLEGWELRDRAGHRYIFGPGSLRSGRSLRLRSGGDPGDDTESDRHWGRKRAVWNNDGDTVLLLDAEHNLRALHVYEGSRR